ncbi:MAG: MarC family protein [Candidatus Nucleicultricaceae bacterium]
MSTFLTLFFIIDPIGVVPIFVGLTKYETEQRRRLIALKASLISAGILITFGFIGDYILDRLHISESSFRIAGGVLLLLAAIDMVVASHTGLSSTTPDEREEAKSRHDISVFPLSIPLIAGPGSLVTVVMQMRQFENEIVLQALIIFMVIVVVAITYVCLIMSGLLSRILGVTGTNVIGRVFGIILAGLAIQFIVDGIKLSFFPQGVA